MNTHTCWLEKKVEIICLCNLLPLPLCSVSLQAKPQTNKAENIFTYFQIATGQNQEHITNKEETLGLYVDKSDWTVKATRDTSLWDKFKITSFATPATH